jgi:hypothetical protein
MTPGDSSTVLLLAMGAAGNLILAVRAPTPGRRWLPGALAVLFGISAAYWTWGRPLPIEVVALLSPALLIVTPLVLIVMIWLQRRPA